MTQSTNVRTYGSDGWNITLNNNAPYWVNNPNGSTTFTDDLNFRNSGDTAFNSLPMG